MEEKLEIVSITKNKPSIRQQFAELVFKMGISCLVGSVFLAITEEKKDGNLEKKT